MERRQNPPPIICTKYLRAITDRIGVSTGGGGIGVPEDVRCFDNDGSEGARMDRV